MLPAMCVVEELHRLGGVAQRRTLVRLTSRRRVERALAAGDVRRATAGTYALPTAHEALLRATEVHGVVSHRSAAAWWGWELKTQPTIPDVTVRKGTRVTGSRRGLHVTDLPRDDVRDAVTSPERTLVDCLRTLPYDEALAVADSALRHLALTPSGLRALAASVRGPGAPAVRQVARDARGEAANPFESVLRALATEAGLDVRPQVAIRHAGESVRPDLVDVDRKLVLEADSFAWHGSRGALRRDARRYNWLVSHGWTVLRFAYEDVMQDPAYVRDLLAAMRAPLHTEVPLRAVDEAS